MVHDCWHVPGLSPTLFQMSLGSRCCCKALGRLLAGILYVAISLARRAQDVSRLLRDGIGSMSRTKAIIVREHLFAATTDLKSSYNTQRQIHGRASLTALGCCGGLRTLGSILFPPGLASERRS